MSARMSAILFPALLLGFVGCTHTPVDSPDTPRAEPAVVVEEGGAELWAENCSRCHNIRPPKSFSDSQWQTITHHMRLRANLTGEETRAITEFLKSSD
jgi:nitrate/TMAO reductase-like tetraheme cytochrome c subunit